MVGTNSNAPKSAAKNVRINNYLYLFLNEFKNYEKKAIPSSNLKI